MPSLHEHLSTQAQAWRAGGWVHSDFPAVAEILAWADAPDGPGFVLRRPQVQAHEVDDSRALVDWVLIDPASDSQTFRIASSDIPERKTDFIQATYTLDAPVPRTAVAVKIIDMLGEEVLVVREV